MPGHAGRHPDTPDVEGVFRAVYGRAVATLVRHFGDITRAEDSVQDAFVVASERWPHDGVPPNPAGWIVKINIREFIQVVFAFHMFWLLVIAFLAQTLKPVKMMITGHQYVRQTVAG